MWKVKLESINPKKYLAPTVPMSPMGPRLCQLKPENYGSALWDVKLIFETKNAKTAIILVHTLHLQLPDTLWFCLPL